MLRHIFGIGRFALQTFRSPRLRGLVRVSVFLFVVNSLLTVAFLAQARGQAEGLMTRLGDRIVGELGPIVAEPQAVKINGQSMFVASRTTRLSVNQAMNLVEQHCRANAPNWLGDQATSARALERLPADMRDLQSLGIPRSDRKDPNAEHAEIACIAHKDADTGFEGAWQRAKRFVDTGNFGEIGSARYFRAETNPGGLTHVLGVWTEGDFNLYQMFPEQGDAPGSDPPHAPRPPESRRLFTAELEGSPYAIRSYASKQPRARIFAFYEAEMARRGYGLAPITLREGKLEQRTDEARGFLKDNGVVFLIAEETPSGSDVSVLEMGTRGVAVGRSAVATY